MQPVDHLYQSLVAVTISSNCCQNVSTFILTNIGANVIFDIIIAQSQVCSNKLVFSLKTCAKKKKLNQPFKTTFLMLANFVFNFIEKCNLNLF